MKMVTHVLFRLRKNIVECVAVLFKLNGENRQTTMTKKNHVEENEQSWMKTVRKL